MAKRIKRKSDSLFTKASANQLASILGILCFSTALVLGATHTITQCIVGFILLGCAFHFIQPSKRYFASPFSFWLGGAWLSLAIACISLIPLPITSYGSYTHHTYLWSYLASLGSQVTYIPLSLSPAHTLMWIMQHLLFILMAYLTYYLHGYRTRILYYLMSIGPILVGIGLCHQVLGSTKVYGVYQSLDRQQLHGFFTPIINQNTAASLMMMSGLLSLAFYFFYQNILVSSLSQSIQINIPISTRPNLTKQRRYRFLFIIASVWNMFGVYLCQARFTLVLFLSFAYLICLKGISTKNKKSILIFIMSLVYGLSLLILIINNESLLLHVKQGWQILFNYKSDTSTSLSQISTLQDYPRFYTWADTINYIKDYYWLGSGRGSFGEVFTAYQTFLTRGWISHTENILLSTWAEGGIISVIGSIIWPIFLWGYWWYRSQGEAHIIAVGVYGTLTALGIQQCSDFGLNNFSLLLCMAALWGMLWSYLPLEKNKKEKNKKTTLSKRLTSQYKFYSFLIFILFILIASLYNKEYRLRALFTMQEHQLQTQGSQQESHDFLRDHHKKMKADQLSTTRDDTTLYFNQLSNQKELYINKVNKRSSLFTSSQIDRNTIESKLPSEWINTLYWHPHSIHLLFLWVQKLDLSHSHLSDWIRIMKRLMPLHANTYHLEARYYIKHNLPDIAYMSYRNTLLYAPWKRKRLYKELNQSITQMNWHKAVPLSMWYDYLQWHLKEHGLKDTIYISKALPLEGLKIDALRVMVLNMQAKNCQLEQMSEMIKQLSSLKQKLRHDQRQLRVYADLIFAQAIQDRCQNRFKKAQKDMRKSLRNLESGLLELQKKRIIYLFDKNL
jgi:hypothetical protein